MTFCSWPAKVCTMYQRPGTVEGALDDRLVVLLEDRDVEDLLVDVGVFGGRVGVSRSLMVPT